MKIFRNISDWYNNLTPRRLRRFQFWMVFFVVILFVYWQWMPLKQIPMELPIGTSTAEAAQASLNFWETYHSNDTRLESVNSAIDQLTVAYESSKEDFILTGLLGGAHLWRYQLRGLYGRTAQESKSDLEKVVEFALITERLQPGEQHTTAPSMYATGEWQLRVLENEATQDLQLDLFRNTLEWPQFASFVQGWLLSAMLEYDDEAYSQNHLSFDYLMKACAGMDIHPNIKLGKLAHTLYGIKLWLFNQPSCYNNPIAPHNVEGSFFIMGDSYLKLGDMELAELWYNNVKSGPAYDDWSYKDQLQERLDNLEALKNKFREDSGKLNVENPAMSFQTDITCAICHAR